MPALYSTLLVTEPDYGERVVRVHAGIHHAGASHTQGIDLLTGECVLLPISTAWDSSTQRDVRLSAVGWSWRPIGRSDAEKRVGLPCGSLPAYGDNSHTDLWVDQRMRCPVFIALLTLLADHPQIVFYEVDWRHWIHVAQPREYPHNDTSPPLSAPKQTTCSGEGRHLPYPLGGSGDMERYASQMRSLLAGASSPAVVKADVVYDTLAEAVLADLADDYQRNVEWQERSIPCSRLNDGPADMPIVRTLADIQTLVGWTSGVLDELEDLYREATERLAVDTAPYQPQGVALSLF